MFEKEKRFEQVIQAVIDFKPVYIFTGIGRRSKLLVEGQDYQVAKQGSGYFITFDESHSLIDIYCEALWPERFTPKEMQKRRRNAERSMNGILNISYTLSLWGM